MFRKIVLVLLVFVLLGARCNKKPAVVKEDWPEPCLAGNGEMPANFPEEFVYPDSMVNTGMESIGMEDEKTGHGWEGPSVTFCAKEEPEKIAKWYQDLLTEKGYELAGKDGGNEWWVKGNESVSTDVIYNPAGEGVTMFSVQIHKKY